MVQRETSFTTLSVSKSLVTFGRFCPCFRFSSSKTKFLNCRLLAVGLGCVNPTRSKASLILLPCWDRSAGAANCTRCSGASRGNRKIEGCRSTGSGTGGDVSIRFSHSLTGFWLYTCGRQWPVMGCHGKTLTWEWLSWIIMGFVLYIILRDFCGGSRLACLAVFCMQMPSGADVATKAFRSWGDWQTYLENVIVEGCWQYVDKQHEVSMLKADVLDCLVHFVP